MNRLIMTICTALLLAGSAAAQKPLPTLEDLIPGGETFRFAKNLYGLQWWGDVCVKPTIDSVFSVNPSNGAEQLLFTRKQVNEALKATGLGQLSHLYQVEFPWENEKKVWIRRPKGYAVYHFEKQTITDTIPMPQKASNADFNAASMAVAYTIDNNLYVNGKAVTDEPEGVVCGQSVHRNEFGIHKGTFWSPSGNLLAFYRMDERMVTEYPLVDTSKRIAETTPIRYPMAGMTSHKVNVGIYSPTSGVTVYLNTGDPTDRYFTNISWSPDEKSLYLIEINREQNQSKLCCYNAQTGELTGTLIEESHPKYVEPQQPIVFLPWNANRFIYQSQRDGYNHLYLYDTKGKCIQQLTSGEWLVKELVGFNMQTKELIATATVHSPLQTNLIKVNVGKGKHALLDAADGVHHPVLSASGSHLIDNYSTPTEARLIDLVDARNGKRVNILKADDPFAAFEMPRIETGTIKAADGVTDLYYRLVKPVDFDESKKYPTIVYVYGGPHAQMVTNGFQYGARGWDIYMATKGYVMFTLDNRGSSNRGLEFENCTFRQLGIEEGKDQVKGVEFLQSLPFVDANRMGVHGWSFGGHMTTALMLRYPDLFKVGVAGGPVIDWKYYEIMYGERYMDTPERNPEGYEACNLNNLAENLKGHLLMIHDDHDDTCVPQHTMTFMKACVDARVYPDLFIYPGHKHNVMGRDRVHLHEKITKYFLSL